MLPDNELSSTVIQAPFMGARALGVTKTVDYVDAGIALNDPSAGLFYQPWRARLVGNDILVDAREVEEFVLYSDTGITEISFTFDQNMRPVLAFVKAGQAYLRWYDTAVGAQVVTALASDVITPRVSMDDKRSMQSSISDLILAYVRSGSLYHRRQRDRFLTEYLLAENISTGLIKIGMNRQFRFQFMLEPS